MASKKHPETFQESILILQRFRIPSQSSMGPRTITHNFFGGGINCRFHRTFVTQGFLAGMFLCNLGAFIRHFL